MTILRKAIRLQSRFTLLDAEERAFDTIRKMQSNITYEPELDENRLSSAVYDHYDVFHSEDEDNY